jgi:hypothetical protein
MKGKRGGASTKVMLALLAVLLVSLGFLSSQGREGFREGLVLTPCEEGTSRKGGSNNCTKD